MKIELPPDKRALQKRLIRFFNNSNPLRNEIYDFLDMIFNQGHFDIYVFGGVIRDIALFSVWKFYSDIDLVANTSSEELKRTLQLLPPDFKINQNRFGGYRIEKARWKFDIWCASETWAFKQNLVKYEDVTSLLKTTFLSWDSALFDLKNKKLICHSSYIDDLRNGDLDIVLKSTPNEIGAIVRLLRAIYSKGVKNLKSRATKFLMTGLKDYSYETLIEYEKNSFTERFISTEKLLDLESALYQQIDKGKAFELSLREQLRLWN